METIMKKLTFCLLAAVLLLASCKGKPDDTSAPLAALQSPNAVENYGDQFWNDQLQRKTELWSRALNFCQQPDHKFLINCQPVLAAAAPRVPFSATMPSNGLGGGLFSVPSPNAQATH
jgi:hypothetical protein